MSNSVWDHTHTHTGRVFGQYHQSFISARFLKRAFKPLVTNSGSMPVTVSHRIVFFYKILRCQQSQVFACIKLLRELPGTRPVITRTSTLFQNYSLAAALSVSLPREYSAMHWSTHNPLYYSYHRFVALFTRLSSRVRLPAYHWSWKVVESPWI